MSTNTPRDDGQNSPGRQDVPPIAPDNKKAKAAKGNGAGTPPEDAAKANGDGDADPAPEVEARPPNGKGPTPEGSAASPPGAEDAASTAEAARPDYLKLVQGGAPEDIFNDIESLRTVAELKVQRRSVAINMEVRKPPDNGYFQCHPDPAQRLDASLVYDKEERDVYFVHPHMMNHPLLLTRLRRMTIVTTYAWPAGIVFLWPVPFPDEKGRVKVWKSARRAFEISCGLATDLDPPGPRWTQMSWNAEARYYAVGTAEGINSQPIWPPGLSLGNSLKIGFAEKTIASEDHYYVRQLRGLT
jgi:hypothetical protein